MQIKFMLQILHINCVHIILFFIFVILFFVKSMMGVLFFGFFFDAIVEQQTKTKGKNFRLKSSRKPFFFRKLTKTNKHNEKNEKQDFQKRDKKEKQIKINDNYINIFYYSTKLFTRYLSRRIMFTR